MIQRLQQPIQLLKSGAFPLEFHNQSSTIEALLLLLQNSSTEPRNLELLQDLVQLIRARETIKLKPRTSILPGIGEIFLMKPETIGLHQHQSLHSATTQVSTTQLGKPHMKLSLGPNHKILRPPSWDFIRKSKIFAVITSVKTSFFILIGRTA